MLHLLSRTKLRTHSVNPLYRRVDAHTNPPRRYMHPVLTSLTEFINTYTITGAGIIALGTFIFCRYKVAGPDQQLVRTGLGISDIKITKQAVHWPLQQYKFIDMHPRNYSFDLHAMSNEKIDFVLPAVFTIGPKNDIAALVKYVRVLENMPDSVGGTNASDATIKGILEGETRILSSSMTMEDLFNNRSKFKQEIIESVQIELDKIGLYIYNANIKELQDGPDSKYFFNLRQKKLSETENFAKIDVAEANKMGNIGHKERETTTRQQLAQLEAVSVTTENARQQEIEKSGALLELVKADARRQREVAQVEATNAINMRAAELQREVEQKRMLAETERLRAADMSAAQVAAEISIKMAEGAARSLCVEAEARYFAKQREADGILAIYNAQSAGLENLAKSLGDDSGTLIQYLMLEKGTFNQLASENAKAIQGLNPRITMYNMGDSKDSQPNSIAGLGKMLLPLFDTIYQQVNKSGKMDDEKPAKPTDLIADSVPQHNTIILPRNIDSEIRKTPRNDKITNDDVTRGYGYPIV